MTPLRMARLSFCLLAMALAGCADQRQPSRIGQTVDGIDFTVPPGGPRTLVDERASAQAGERQRTEPAAVYPGRPVDRPPGLDAGTAVRRTPGGVQVNFDNASVREVAAVILGDVLDVPYTIDPNVAGEITLSSGGAIPERDLLLIFETALRAQGFGLVDTGTGYLIAPFGEIVGRSALEPLGGEPLEVAPGVGVTVVPLRYIGASTAAQFIQPLLHTPEDVRIDEQRNLILFTGTGPERQNVVDTLTAIDVDWLVGRSVGIFPLARATPEAMIPELEALFDAGAGGSPGMGPVQFLPLARLNAVLAIAPTATQIRAAEDWVARLDRGRAERNQFFVYDLQHAPAKDVAEILNAVFVDSVEVASQGLFEQPALFGQGLVDEGLDEDLAAGAPNAGIAGLTTSATDVELGPIRIVPNVRDNSLLVRASPRSYEMIEPTIRRLDRASAQVLIEATIAEVLLNDALRYGIQYYLDTSGATVAFNDTTPGTITRQSGLEPFSRIPGFNFLYTAGSANVTIDALSQITDVRVLSAPSVVVEDNSEAELIVGDQVPITTRTAVSVDDSTAPVVNNIEYRDTGVILQVRPRINSNQVVSLEVAQEVSRALDQPASAIGTTNQAPTPTIQQRRITSQINILSGQTVVLGGLIQDSEERSRQRIPILGDIPIIGPFFGGNTRTERSRTELIVFLTPRVIRSAEDARDVSRELRDRMRSLRARDFAPDVIDEEIEQRPLPLPVEPESGPTPVIPRSNEPAPVLPRTGRYGEPTAPGRPARSPSLAGAYFIFPPPSARPAVALARHEMLLPQARPHDATFAILLRPPDARPRRSHPMMIAAMPRGRPAVLAAAY